MEGTLPLSSAQLLEQFEQTVRTAPGDTATRFSLARLLLEVGRLEEALDHMGAALVRQPFWPQAWLALSDVHEKLGDWNKARSALIMAQAAVAAEPDLNAASMAQHIDQRLLRLSDQASPSLDP